jgi:CheY-like chemotaxis protein/two-component sensor histidine kinase
MERQLNQMVRLVDDLLDVSRITTGKLAIKRSRVALQPIVQNAIESIGPFIEQRKHRLSIHMPERPVFLDADAMRLSQVFSNLLNNSAKYTNPGGNIGFSTYVEQGQIVIKVVDDGIGIPSQILPDIFKMFTQADYSLERVNAGLGVGLTLAKRLIELHGGTIEAHSEGVDRGSTFIVRLPAASDEPQNHGEKQGGDAAGTNERYRILLADDNVDFATSLATLLRAMDHEVLITHNGLDALAAAPGFDPEFAFLDIGLPGLNGYALARRLRDLPATHDCVLVAVTGWGQEKDRQLAQQAGFDHHMVKPVEPGKIQAILQKAWRVA